MARVEISEVVLSANPAGITSAVTGASVQVNIRATGASAVVYSAPTGGGTITQPLTTSSGRIEGWVEEGSYDLVVTNGSSSYTQRFEAVSGSTTFNVKSYGARGDGANNDTSAVQAALTAAGASGGEVFVPPGTYKMTAGLTVPLGVNLRGAHRYATTLLWAADLGAGVYALAPAEGDATSAPTISGITLQGPGSVYTLGVQTANMDGIALSSNVHLQDGYTIGFRAGVCFIGNHQVLRSWKSSSNYYNGLWQNSRTTMGNQVFHDCRFDGAMFAAWAVEGSNTLDGVVADGVDLGSSPFGIYKFDGPASGNPAVGTIVESKLRNVSFEGTGNSAIFDASTIAGSLISMNAVVFENVGFTWDAGRKIGAVAADYAVKLRNAQNFRVHSPVYPFTAGAVAAFYFNDASVISGLYGNEIDCGAVVANMFAGECRGLRVKSGDDWTAVVATTAAAVTLGQVMQMNSTYFARHYGDENRATFGIALNTAGGGAPVIVAVEGEVQALCRVVDNGGIYLTPDAAGLTILRPLSNVGTFGHSGSDTSTPAKHPVIAMSTGSGGGAGGSLMPVRLIPPMFDRAFVAPGAVSALPGAGSGYRGQMLTVEGAGGVADGLYVCKKTGADTYVWAPVTVNGESATVASATAVTLPLQAGSVYTISGTTTITSVVATGHTGRVVTLVFSGILTFTDGSNLKLAGNFVTTADDAITLACDGTNWFEVARSVN